MAQRLPDFEALDHSANRRRLSEIVGDDPTILHTYRGPWCPKEQRFFRRLVTLQDELEVSYCRLVSLSVDPPEVAYAYRAGLGARWPFLCDPDRHVLDQLGLRETTDTVHDPYVPRVFVLRPDRSVESEYDGYWFVGRPTLDELVLDLRRVCADVRDGWAAPTP